MTPTQHKLNSVANSHQLQGISSEQIQNTVARDLKEKSEAKRLHGQFPRGLDEGLIDKEQSGDIK
jgi:hypothetical protein